MTTAWSAGCGLMIQLGENAGLQGRLWTNGFHGRI
jgi:hypothetical protein